MSKFYELSEETIETFNRVFKQKSFPISIGFQFVGCENQKMLVKISRMPEHFEFLLQKELLIIINEDLFNVFDEDSIQILIEQELDKISINMESGKIKLVKPDLTTFSGLISKYGIERVSRANQISTLAISQKDDNDIIKFK